jgi:hypothetical protein
VSKRKEVREVEDFANTEIRRFILSANMVTVLEGPTTIRGRIIRAVCGSMETKIIILDEGCVGI